MIKREDFENWFLADDSEPDREPLYLSKNENGEYVFFLTKFNWKAYQAGAEAEREACATECEREMMFPGGRQESFAHHGVVEAAKAIRARSKQ